MSVSVFELAAEPDDPVKKECVKEDTFSHKIIKIFCGATKILLRFLGQVLETPRRAPQRLFFATTGVAATHGMTRAKDCERNGVSEHLG